MKKSIYILALLLVTAGILHFLSPGFFLKIMPSYLPYHLPLVYLSGLAEIICGILLCIPKTQIMGAWLSILLFITVFPANIEMAQQYYHQHSPYFWATILRLPLQMVLIYWAYQFTKQKNTFTAYSK